jgi:hypothetical protein
MTDIIPLLYVTLKAIVILVAIAGGLVMFAAFVYSR